MITVQPFNLEVIKTHKCFYLLRHIADAAELQIIHNTPAGHIETDVADAFAMPNGKIIIAWNLPLHISAMHNLLVINGLIAENVNLVSLERVIDIYDRPVDAQTGTFIFTNSDMILAPNHDWRCDNGKFGPKPFQDVKIIDQLSEILVYEPVLSINGVGHLIYIEGVSKQDVANYHLSQGEMPTTGRTLWETLKLIREWAIVNQEPFNNIEAVAYKAHQFIEGLKLTEQELAVIDQQIPMQIANYLTGHTNARQRPDGVLPITDNVKNLVFNRLASGSLSALEYTNPGMWDLQELLQHEQEQLLIDVQMLFRNTPNGWENRLHNVLHTRYLNNKKIILDKVAAGQL
jgi:hypothetical protein